MGFHELAALFERQNAAVVSQRMDHHRGILPSLDDFVEIAYRAVANCHGERAVMPDRPLGVEQITPHQIGSRHVLVTSDRDQRPLEDERHVLDKPRLAAAGRPLEHDRHALGVSRLEQPHFIGDGAVVRPFADPELVKLHAVGTYAIGVLRFPRREAGKARERRRRASAMRRRLLVWNAFDRALVGTDGRTRERLHHGTGTFRIGDPLLIEVIRADRLAAHILA